MILTNMNIYMDKMSLKKAIDLSILVSIRRVSADFLFHKQVSRILAFTATSLYYTQ